MRYIHKKPSDLYNIALISPLTGDHLHIRVLDLGIKESTCSTRAMMQALALSFSLCLDISGEKGV